MADRKEVSAGPAGIANRVGGILALVAFAMCLLVGAFEAENGFVVVVRRALLAMLGTYVVGYLVGVAAERMLSENARAAAQRLAAEKKATADGSPQASATDGR